MSYPYYTRDNFPYRGQKGPDFRCQISTELIVPTPPSLTLADLPAEAQGRIRHYQAAAQARNTSRAYGVQLGLFKGWCHQQGYSDTPPVPPAIVARWLVERADAGASRSTLAVALAAVKFGHRIASQRFDASDPDLQRALAGARREAVREQRQAAPLRPAVLGDLLANFGDSDLDRRDAAMLSTLYMLALRRSELVEIDYEQRGDGLAVLRMTDDGLELELLRSKTEQERPITIAVDRSCNPRGFAALERWIAHAEIAPGTALFRRIYPRGGIGGRISGDGVNRAVKSALRTILRGHRRDARQGRAVGIAVLWPFRSCRAHRGGERGGLRRFRHRQHNPAPLAADDQTYGKRLTSAAERRTACPASGCEPVGSRIASRATSSI